MAKDRDKEHKGRNVLLAAATPSLPRDEKTERAHSKTAKQRVEAAKKGGKR